MASIQAARRTDDVVLRRAADGTGDGVMATRAFTTGETVMVGYLIGYLTGNDSHATQVSPNSWAQGQPVLRSQLRRAPQRGAGVRLRRPALHRGGPGGDVRLRDAQLHDRPFPGRVPVRRGGVSGHGHGLERPPPCPPERLRRVGGAVRPRDGGRVTGRDAWRAAGSAGRGRRAPRQPLAGDHCPAPWQPTNSGQIHHREAAAPRRSATGPDPLQHRPPTPAPDNR